MNKDKIIHCHESIKAYVHRTPVLTSGLINGIVGAEVFFKCENFQKMGAFKMRGAINAIMNLSDTQKKMGVVTHSSGNFAQALSLSAKLLGIKAYIVMPSTASQVKKNAVNGYGGHLVECEPTMAMREKTAQAIVAEHGATFIHPSNDADVIIGNATSAKELLEQHSDLDVIFAPVGGGGLIAGTALSALYFGDDCQVIGGEPEAADDAYRSMISGKIESNVTALTIADGLKTELGDINFPIIIDHVERIIRVSEAEIVAAMRLIWERLKILAEPSSAVAFAALIKEKSSFKGKKTGIIISGGNVDLSNLPF
ncbi:MAG: threonine/serine dehydratase [Saprospiraceae bacterium]